MCFIRPARAVCVCSREREKEFMCVELKVIDEERERRESDKKREKEEKKAKRDGHFVRKESICQM